MTLEMPNVGNRLNGVFAIENVLIRMIDMEHCLIVCPTVVYDDVGYGLPSHKQCILEPVLGYSGR